MLKDGVSEGSQTQKAECHRIPFIWLSEGGGTVRTENRSAGREEGYGLTAKGTGTCEEVTELLCISVAVVDTQLCVRLTEGYTQGRILPYISYI